MNYDKIIKKQIIEEASANPKKYFPTEMLESYGFKRQKCQKCGVMFWSISERKTCGDTNCVEEYSFIGETPAKQKLEFCEVYSKWRKFIEKRGYMHVDRFPVVARWRDDLDFNIASIIGFQPFVTKGIIPPPNDLVSIPQNCLRFPDIDNVGYTGRHTTGFVMIGQCAFKEPNKYDQEKYVKDLLDFFLEIVKIPIEELQLHEDAWLGGGDCGPSIEFFSRGLELANQVYMWYDMSNAKDISELKPLKIKVLDMGMGLERVCWFSKGSLNIYEATMPKVCQYLFKKTQLKPDLELYKNFTTYSGMLNLDEVDDIHKAWQEVIKLMQINLSVEELIKKIEPLAGIYSIADHTKTLLYALADGALPSNVKGGYNLRLILRRALDFIYKYNWNIDIYEIMSLHAEELSPLYPELKQELPNIKKILDVEKIRYLEHKKKVQLKIERIIKKKPNLQLKDYIKYYISDGITPFDIKNAFNAKGLNLEIPPNFYSSVNEYFETNKNKKKEALIDELKSQIKDLPKTKLLFYSNQDLTQLEDANILKEFQIQNKKYIILDKTIFYPTMGGQISDTGKIDKYNVKNVLKINNIIIHEITEP